VKNNVDPDTAIMRFKKFLALLDTESATEAAATLIEPAAPIPDALHETPPPEV
jgi:hypothetical protein